MPESVPPGTYRPSVDLTCTDTTVVAYDRTDIDAEPEHEERTVTRRPTIPVVVWGRLFGETQAFATT